MGQARSNRYSGHNQTKRDSESNQVQRHTTIDRYPQEEQDILQRIE